MLVGIRFSTISTILWIMYLHLEGIFFLFARRVWLTVKEGKERAVKSRINLVYYLPSTSILLILFFLTVIVAKASSTNFVTAQLNIITAISFNLCFLVSIAYWYFVLSGSSFNMFTTFSMYNMLCTIYTLYFCHSFITLLFILEVFSVYYYFFFLNVHSESGRFNILQYKNLLLFFLWNSFLTTMIYGLGMYYFTSVIGTLDFEELYYLYDRSLSPGFFFFFISFFWKLGAPGFHFLKIEIYKYLDSQSIFFFSTVTVTINLLLFYFICTQQVILLFMAQVTLLPLVALCMLFSIVFFFSADNLYSFLAWSSVVTLFTAIVPLIV